MPAETLPKMFKGRPEAMTSDQAHWYNAFQPLEYRGFMISRDLTYQNLWTITLDTKHVTGLHGLYNGLEHAKRQIDKYIDMNSSKTEDADTQTHIEQ